MLDDTHNYNHYGVKMLSCAKAFVAFVLIFDILLIAIMTMSCPILPNFCYLLIVHASLYFHCMMRVVPHIVCRHVHTLSCQECLEQAIGLR